jgi:ABC-type uncharacterized transport system permease subunit
VTGVQTCALPIWDERWGRWCLRFLAAAAALQAAAFLCLLPAFWFIAENRYLLPVNTRFGALTLLSLCVAATFFIVESRRRLGILGAFVLPWTVLFCAGASLAPMAVGASASEARPWWLNLQPVLLMAAYAAFANAFGVGLAWLLQDRQIKSRAPIDVCYRLPALEKLDDLHFRLITVGVAHLGAGLLIGRLRLPGLWRSSGPWDMKLLAAGFIATVYVGYLYMHAARGWRGRRGVYLAMAAFLALAGAVLAGHFRGL